MAAGDLIITAVAKAALLVRLKATELEGGKFSSPSQKNAELRSIIKDLVNGIGPTG